MKQGLGDAVVESALELEKYFYEHFADIFEKHKEAGKRHARRRHKLTLGDKAFEEKLRERLPGKIKLLFDWFLKTRNAILHHGDSPKRVEEHQKIRDITTLKDITQAKTALQMLLELGKETKEDVIQRACKSALTERVFQEVFGEPIKPLAESGIQNQIELPQQKIETQIAEAPISAPMPHDKAEEKNWSDDPKLIVIKPPILIPALAARLGIQPFNIMANLIKLGVFPAPNQPLEPEIAAKICEIHGFTFERNQG